MIFRIVFFDLVVFVSWLVEEVLRYIDMWGGLGLVDLDIKVCG